MVTAATGKSKRNLNSQGKLSKRSLERLPRFFVKNSKLMFQFSFFLFACATFQFAVVGGNRNNRTNYTSHPLSVSWGIPICKAGKGPAKRIQHHPTLLNPTLLDDVAQCSTRWPNERNMLASEADYFGLDVIKIYLQFVFDLFISPLSLFPDMILLTKYVPRTWSFFQ